MSGTAQDTRLESRDVDSLDMYRGRTIWSTRQKGKTKTTRRSEDP